MVLPVLQTYCGKGLNSHVVPSFSEVHAWVTLLWGLCVQNDIRLRTVHAAEDCGGLHADEEPIYVQRGRDNHMLVEGRVERVAQPALLTTRS